MGSTKAATDRNILTSMVQLANEARDLYLPETVPVLKSTLHPLEFYRNHVSKNLPVIFDSGNLDWPAFEKWKDSSYLMEKLEEKRVNVAVTPTGYADAPLNDEIFMLPHEMDLSFACFCRLLQDREKRNGIFYIQKQNSNFLEEFSELVADADTEIPWASQAFGKLPDAVNFWMGDGQAITSMHKDHYENLYVVVRGSKTFILHPPTDLPFIPYKMYPVGKYVMDDQHKFTIKRVHSMTEVEVMSGIKMPSKCPCEECILNTSRDKVQRTCNGELRQDSRGCSNAMKTTQDSDLEPLKSSEKECEKGADKGFVMLSDTGGEKFHLETLSNTSIPDYHVPWVAVDPINPDFKKFPQYKEARQIKCTLTAGQTLYLPSLWFHHVSQSHGTIAINFWYDMEYDIKYNYFKCIESLVCST